jgi:hypothetical protein
MVDIRDVARLHVIGLLSPQVHNERLFAWSEPFNWSDIIALLQKLRPENSKLPTPPEKEGRDLSDVGVPRARAKELLQSFFGVEGFKSIEQSIKEGLGNV